MATLTPGFRTTGVDWLISISDASNLLDGLLAIAICIFLLPLLQHNYCSESMNSPSNVSNSYLLFLFTIQKAFFLFRSLFSREI